MGRVWITLSMLGIATGGALSAVPPSAAGAGDSPAVATPGSFESLTAVDATGPDDAWAVGFSRSDHQTTALALHWNGSSWAEVSTPDVPLSSHLDSVSMLSPSDGWAVGTSDELHGSDSIYHGSTLVEHWNGTKWKRVPSVDPNPDFKNVLTAVTAISADDVWAAGYRYYDDEEGPVSLTEHWDGTSWSWIQSGIPGEYRKLYGTAASSSSDVWAVGKSDEQGFSQHWDGSSFTRFDPPVRRLRAVVAISPTDAWAVGGTTAVHWDGVSWTLASTPAIGGLLSLGATGSSDVWMASRRHFAHWDGTTWTRVGSPRVDVLRGMAAESPTDVWAVGQNEHAALIEHWDGTEWTVVT